MLPTYYSNYSSRDKVGDLIASQSPIDADNYHVFSVVKPRTGSSDTSVIGGTATSRSVCLRSRESRVGISRFLGNPSDWERRKLPTAQVIIECNMLIL